MPRPKISTNLAEQSLKFKKTTRRLPARKAYRPERMPALQSQKVAERNRLQACFPQGAAGNPWDVRSRWQDQKPSHQKIRAGNCLHGLNSASQSSIITGVPPKLNYSHLSASCSLHRVA